MNLSIIQNIIQLKKFCSYLFLLVPISFILGNAAINILILIINIFFVYFILSEKIKLSNFFWISLFLILICSIKDIIFLNSYNFKTLFLIRYLLFIEAFIFFVDNNTLRNLKYISFISVVIIIIDLNFQYLNFENILGLTSQSIFRVSSFFGDEWIAGSYLYKISLILIPTYFLKQNKSILILIFLCIFESIFITGERTSFFIYTYIITALIIITEKKIKNYLFYFISLMIIFVSIFLLQKQNEIKLKRYSPSNLSKFLNFEVGTQTRLMKYGLIIGKENLILGIGTKNFKEACDKKYLVDDYFKKCENHPHNHLIEIFLSHGIFIFIIIIMFLIKNYIYYFKNLKKIKMEDHIYQIVFSTYFFPPFFSGSIFSTWTAAFVSLNLALILRSQNLK
jgi:O-antigen ligase